MNIRAIRTPIFKENEDLIAFIYKYVKKPKEGSVLVVTSKIVALAEGRTSNDLDSKQRAALIKSESDFALETKYAWLTIKDGMVMANAGVDASNAAGKLVLLPKDSFAAADALCTTLRKKWKLKKLGLLISDSRLLPFRAGIVGVALGYAGFRGVRDYRGTKDIFGKEMTMTQLDIADSLASAAVVEMGEGNERQPLAVISDAPIEFVNKINPDELKIDIREDLYGPLFAKISRKSK